MNTYTIRNTLSTVALTTCLMTQSVAAETLTPTTQAQGFAWGAVIGTLVAGPAGTVVGAGFGSMAEHGNNLKQQVDQLRQQQQQDQTELNQYQTRLSTLAIHNTELKKQLSDAQQRPELTPLLEALMLDIHFRSNSAVIEPHYYPRLSALAAQIAKLPAFHIEMVGFTDPRGRAAYNHELAKRRVESLEHYLTRAGVEQSQLCIQIKGESAPLVQTQQPALYPFERRVVLTFKRMEDNR